MAYVCNKHQWASMNVLTKTVLECSGDVLHHIPILNFWLALSLQVTRFSRLQRMSRLARLVRLIQLSPLDEWPHWGWGGFTSSRSPVYSLYVEGCLFSQNLCSIAVAFLKCHVGGFLPQHTWTTVARGKYVKTSSRPDEIILRRCTAKPPWRCEDSIFRLN